LAAPGRCGRLRCRFRVGLCPRAGWSGGGIDSVARLAILIFSDEKPDGRIFGPMDIPTGSRRIRRHLGPSRPAAENPVRPAGTPLPKQKGHKERRGTKAPPGKAGRFVGPTQGPDDGVNGNCSVFIRLSPGIRDTRGTAFRGPWEHQFPRRVQRSTSRAGGSIWLPLCRGNEKGVSIPAFRQSSEMRAARFVCAG